MTNVELDREGAALQKHRSAEKVLHRNWFSMESHRKCSYFFCFYMRKSGLFVLASFLFRASLVPHYDIRAATFLQKVESTNVWNLLFGAEMWGECHRKNACKIKIFEDSPEILFSLGSDAPTLIHYKWIIGLLSSFHLKQVSLVTSCKRTHIH